MELNAVVFKWMRALGCSLYYLFAHPVQGRLSLLHWRISAPVPAPSPTLRTMALSCTRIRTIPTDHGQLGGMQSCLPKLLFWVSSWLPSCWFISLHNPTVLGVPAQELLVFIAGLRRLIAQVFLKEDIVLISLTSLPGGTAD